MNWSRLLFWRSFKPAPPLTGADVDRYLSEFCPAADSFRNVSWCVLYHFVFLAVLAGVACTYAAVPDHITGPKGQYIYLTERVQARQALEPLWALMVCVAWVLLSVQLFLMPRLPQSVPYKHWIHSVLKFGLIGVIFLWPFFAAIANVALGRMCELAGALSRSESLGKRGRQAARNFWIMLIDTLLLVIMLVIQAKESGGNPVLSGLAAMLLAFGAYSYGHLFFVLRYAGRVLDKAAKGEKVP